MDERKNPEWQRQSESPAVYSAEERRAVETYIQNAFGPIERVYVDAAPQLARVDVVVCAPGKGRSVYTLCTIGMGARRMAVGQEKGEHNQAFAELQLLLPASWHIDEAAWPFQLLKETARRAYLPGGAVELGSAYHGAVPQESGFCAVLAAPPAVQGKLPPRVLLPGGKMVNFFLLMPLLPEEWRYMRARKSTFALFRRMAAGGGVVAAPGRKSCVDENNWFASDIAPFVWTQDARGASLGLTDMSFCAERFARSGRTPDGALWARTARACFLEMKPPLEGETPVFAGTGGVLLITGTQPAALRRFALHLRDGCETPQLDNWIKKALEETI